MSMEELELENLVCKLTKEDYNKEKVYYCGVCLSLKVLKFKHPSNEEEDDCYCGMCSSTDIKTSSIEEWELLFQNRYGYKFLNIKKK